MTTAYHQTHQFVEEHGSDVVSRRHSAVMATSHLLILTCSRCHASTEIHVGVEDMPAIVELFARKPS